MSIVVFENTGEMDIRSFKTFGISAKETKNPIGYFGTGLKYAIAILLREKHQITIQSGEQVFEFGLSTTKVRNQEFEIVTCNGEELPFTIDLGKNWKMWQAFREIYCNALDEQGETYVKLFTPKPTKDVTRVIVKGKGFEDCFYRKDEIVLNLDKSLLCLEKQSVEVYDRKSEFIYYRGIRVAKLDFKTRLTYNFLNGIQLTEDRTLYSEASVKNQLCKVISALSNKKLLREILTIRKDFQEHYIDYEDLNYWGNWQGKEFAEVLQDEYQSNNDWLNISARKYYAKKMSMRALKNYVESPMSEVEQKQFDKCVSICHRLYPDFGDYPILIVKTLGETTMALADREKMQIVISKSAFDKGTKYLLSTLIEEYAHLKTGYDDLTRSLQTWLFDQICTITENHVIGGPI